jgi:PmbA protein
LNTTHKEILNVDESIEHLSKHLHGMRDLAGWEIYAEEEKRLCIEVKDQMVESFVSAKSYGISLRTLYGKKMGLSYTNNLNTDSLEDMAERARQAAAHMPEDDANAFVSPPKDGKWPQIDICDQGLSSISEDEKIKSAMMIEKSALDFHESVKNVRGAEYEEILGKISIVNSLGTDARIESTLVIGSLEAIADDGKEAQSGSGFETFHYYDMLDVEKVGREAADRAVSLLGGRIINGGKMPVVFAPCAAANIISVLAPAVCGDSVYNGRSWLSGKLGSKIASGAVTIYDDPMNVLGPGAHPMDDEGTVSQITKVIEKGNLQHFLYDEFYGRKTGNKSTGNGMKPSYPLPPGVDVSNWTMQPGSRTEDDLIKDVDDGIYIMELLGLHTADSVSGDFSLGFSGFRIKSGMLARPVTGSAIAGTMSELLLHISDVADIIKFEGDCGAPAVLVDEIDVSSPDHSE